MYSSIQYDITGWLPPVTCFKKYSNYHTRENLQLLTLGVNEKCTLRSSGRKPLFFSFSPTRPESTFYEVVESEKVDFNFQLLTTVSFLSVNLLDNNNLLISDKRYCFSSYRFPDFDD